MLELLRRRAPERRDVQAGRIALADDVADGAALARGVHPLQHEQHAARAALAALGVELLLQRRDALGQLRVRLLGRVLALLEAGGGARVDAEQVDRAGGGAEECGDRRLGHSRARYSRRTSTAGWVGVGAKCPGAPASRVCGVERNIQPNSAHPRHRHPEPTSSPAAVDVRRSSRCGGFLPCERMRAWSSRASTSRSGSTPAGCAPSSPRRARAGRIPASSSTPTSSSSPSPRCAGRCGWPATASSSPCPRSTTASSRPGRCSASTTRARCAGRPTPTRRRWRTSTPTSTPRSAGWRSTRTGCSARPGTARAGTSRSARRCARRSAPPRAGTRPGCTTASSARTPTPARSPAPRRSRASC